MFLLELSNQRAILAVVEEAAKEATRYVNPRRSQEPRNLEEALMSSKLLSSLHL